MPVVSPLPEIPRLVAATADGLPVPPVDRADDPGVVPDLREHAALQFYEGVPQLWGLSTIDDQRLAGLIMKIGAGLLLWLLIAVIFFRWAGEEDRRIAARRRWQDLDRELTRMGTTST